MSRIEWKYCEKSVTRESIQELEEKLGIVFPNDYIECAMKNNGGGPTPYNIDILNNTIVFGFLLSYRDDSDYYIVRRFKKLDGYLLKGVYPFADDPSGNYYCFDYRKNKENPQIVYLRSELAVSADDVDEEYLDQLESIQEKALVYLCDSFTELLEKLY